MSAKSESWGDLARRPFGRKMRAEFFLETDIAYLNHGGYGATPRKVLAMADEIRARMERQPTQFYRQLPDRLSGCVALQLAPFLKASAEHVVFVDNATSGANAVLQSLTFRPGDELLTTDHVYGAVRKTLQHVAKRNGATVVEAKVPFPLGSEDEIVAAITSSFTPRTRILVIDHVTSPTALVFPVARIAAAAKAQGIRVLVDGAHAPGMLDLDVPSLGVDYYVGNCHKWMVAPKSCAFLWAAPEAWAGLHPTVISHGHGGGAHAQFHWTGTRDYSPCLALTWACGFIETLGATRIREHNHALVRAARSLLCERWSQPPAAPESMLGSTAAVAIPATSPFASAPATRETVSALNHHLWDKHRIEVPAVAFADRLWVRISAQIYNDTADYRRLADALLA